MPLPITNCEVERNFSKLSEIKNKLLSTILEERLNYLFVRSVESYVAKSLSYCEVIKEYAAKKV